VQPPELRVPEYESQHLVARHAPVQPLVRRALPLEERLVKVKKVAAQADQQLALCRRRRAVTWHRSISASR
jgi:hypothetical protein